MASIIDIATLLLNINTITDYHTYLIPRHSGLCCLKTRQIKHFCDAFSVKLSIEYGNVDSDGSPLESTPQWSWRALVFPQYHFCPRETHVTSSMKLWSPNSPFPWKSLSLSLSRHSLSVSTDWIVWLSDRCHISRPVLYCRGVLVKFVEDILHSNHLRWIALHMEEGANLSQTTPPKLKRFRIQTAQTQENVKNWRNENISTSFPHQIVNLLSNSALISLISHLSLIFLFPSPFHLRRAVTGMFSHLLKLQDSWNEMEERLNGKHTKSKQLPFISFITGIEAVAQSLNLTRIKNCIEISAAKVLEEQIELFSRDWSLPQEQISSKVPYCSWKALSTKIYKDYNAHQELWRLLQDSCPSKWSHICSQLFLLWQWTLREVLRVSWKNDISTMHSMQYAMYGMQISVTYHSYHSYHLRRTTKTLNCERQLGDHHLVRCIRLAKLADIQTFNSSRSGIFFCTIFYDSNFCPLWSFVILVSVFCFSVCLVVL